MINTFNIIGFIIIIIIIIIIETIQIYSCILLQIIICLVCFQEDTCNEGKVMWPFKQCCFLLFPFIFWTTNALSIWRKVAHPPNRATLYSCVYNCDDLLSYNSSPRSSHIWFSYIHNFRATLYEPTFLTFPYKTWQKVGWTKRLAQQADMWWYMWATVQSSIVNFSPYSLCIILHYGLPTEVN